jgi:uncharacterized protein
MKRNAGALRDHPQHNTPLRLAIGIVFQIFSWQVSRLVDRGRFNPKMIDVNPFELYLPRLSSDFDGFRIVHVSDIHMGTWMNATRLSGIVDLINHQHADLVAITGDFVSYTIEQPLQTMLEPLKRIWAADGRFAVMGNHDVWTDPTAVREMLDQTGIRELRNQAVTLSRNGSCLHICGVDNAYEKLADLAPILDTLPPEGAAVLLAHEPDFADRSSAAGRFDLQLSGHSHGGQLNLPLVGPPFLPHLAKKYPRGCYQIKDMLLYTNRGLGTTALQMRYRCPPEIAVITLRTPGQGR